MRHSQRVTRRTPLFEDAAAGLPGTASPLSTDLHPVSSHSGQGMRNFSSRKRTDAVYQRRVVRDPSDFVAAGGAAGAVVAVGVVRTRSVGDAFTIAVESRCSQSPMP